MTRTDDKRGIENFIKNIKPTIQKCRDRKKLWLLLPGGYHNVRVLSWLKREMKLLL